jgi:uncharacterized protein DUF6625
MFIDNLPNKKAGGTPALPRIAFILVYFGRAPWYFKFFNKSCSYNPDIDFFLITDFDLPGDLSDNITVARSSLGEISKRATEKLGFEINIVRPFKLCDLRPAYGLIFEDLVEGYDFWGYCDIDLVFGNIRSLITADILNRHDIVTAKKGYIAGFFSLFRNTEKINNIFKKSKDYKKVFQEPVDYCFDECNWEWRALNEGKDILELNSGIDSITHVIKSAERTGAITAYWHTMEYHPGKIVWDRGDLLYNNTERALLCHFIFLKNYDFKYVPNWKTIPERIYMNSFYFSIHAPGSLPDRLLRPLLLTARSVKRGLNILSQYAQWVPGYLFASNRIDLKDIQYPDGLTGNYRFQKRVVSVFILNHRLHANLDGLQLPLLHKGAGKFVLAKFKFKRSINVEFNFSFNEHISAYMLQVTGSGRITHTFFKIS